MLPRSHNSTKLTQIKKHCRLVAIAVVLIVGAFLRLPISRAACDPNALVSRVSVASDGTEGSGGTNWPYTSMAISKDGQFVAFSSSASNLVPDDTNGTQDIFVYDRQ